MSNGKIKKFARWGLPTYPGTKMIEPPRRQDAKVGSDSGMNSPWRLGVLAV
jgi:hypothetical protein